MWTVRSGMGAVLLIGVLCVAAWNADAWGWVPAWVQQNAWWGPISYGGIAFLQVIVVPRWRYRVHRWEVTSDVIYTRTGWATREWQLVPVSRIQTVDYNQGWLERLFRLATLEVQTASHAGSSTIEGLDTEQARQISEELAIRAGTLQDDAT